MKYNKPLITALLTLLFTWQSAIGAIPVADEEGWLITNNKEEPIVHACFEDFLIEMGGASSYVVFIRKRLKSLGKNFVDYWKNPYPTLAVADDEDCYRQKPFQLMPGETLLLERLTRRNGEGVAATFAVDLQARASQGHVCLSLPYKKAFIVNDGKQSLYINELETELLPRQRLKLQLTEPSLTLTLDGVDATDAHCTLYGIVPGLQLSCEPLDDEELGAAIDEVVTRGGVVRPYHKPAHVSQEVWDTLKPYFLPENAVLRNKLDKLFTSDRVLANNSSLQKAGFKNTKPGRFSHIIVSAHRGIDSFIFKFFSDESSRVDWPQLLRRAEGARSLQAAIDRHHWGKWFAVPKKWIYPLPYNAPNAKDGSLQKNFILVCEEMDIYARNQNYTKWKSDITRSKLNALYVLLTEEGLVDSPLAFNIPYCRDGRIAFIDLEHHHRWPIPYYKLLNYLRDDMREYWQQLIDQGGPK